MAISKRPAATGRSARAGRPAAARLLRRLRQASGFASPLPSSATIPPEALGGWCLLRSSKPLSRAVAAREVGSIPMRFRH